MSETGFKAQQGRQSGEHREKITLERLAAFRAAVGAKDRGEAPPTFLTSLRASEFSLLDDLEIPLKKVLHAEQGYTYENPLRAGDEVVYRTTLSQVLEKRGSSGGMIFFVLETAYEAIRGDSRVPVGRSRTNFVVRNHSPKESA